METTFDTKLKNIIGNLQSQYEEIILHFPESTLETFLDYILVHMYMRKVDVWDMTLTIEIFNRDIEKYKNHLKSNERLLDIISLVLFGSEAHKIPKDQLIIIFGLTMFYKYYWDDGDFLDEKEMFEEVSNLLTEKNRKYGDAALTPLGLLGTDKSGEGILIRMDDKLKRFKNQEIDEDEDVLKDLIGYFVLYLISTYY